MAGASRRGYGADGIYFDHRGDCRDSAHHRTCAGRWRGVVSLGFDADGKRVRKKVSGQTRTEVKDKLKAVHSELDAGVRSAAGYTVEKAVADWLDEGLPGRAAKSVEAHRDSLRPLLAVIGAIPLKDLTVQDVRTALNQPSRDRPLHRPSGGRPHPGGTRAVHRQCGADPDRPSPPGPCLRRQGIRTSRLPGLPGDRRGRRAVAIPDPMALDDPAIVNTLSSPESAGTPQN
jgi:hypothetical protein